MDSFLFFTIVGKKLVKEEKLFIQITAITILKANCTKNDFFMEIL